MSIVKNINTYKTIFVDDFEYEKVKNMIKKIMLVTSLVMTGFFSTSASSKINDEYKKRKYTEYRVLMEGVDFIGSFNDRNPKIERYEVDTSETIIPLRNIGRNKSSHHGVMSTVSLKKMQEGLALIKQNEKQRASRASLEL